MAERPNLILVIVEHWRGDCLEHLGHPVLETPTLGSLAAEGQTFTRGYSPCPSCIAARRSIMTGMTPTNHGMVGYEDGRPWPYRHTLAGELRDHGYQTINVGKTHHHPVRLHLGYEELVVPQDYDEWLDQQYPHLPNARNAHGVDSNSWCARPAALPEDHLEEAYFVGKAMDALEKRDPTRPFFLTLSFNGVHPPWCPPRFLYDEYMAREMPVPAQGAWSECHHDNARYPMGINDWRGTISPQAQHRAQAAFYASMTWVDFQLNRFSRFLGRSGLMGNTMIAITADHGEMLGDHHLWRKTYAYEGSACIPYIVLPPHSWGAVPRNRLNESLVGLEDIMPTFLDAAGVPIPDTVDGKSLVPLLRGEDVAWRDAYHHEHSPCYHHENAYHALSAAEWKYVWNPITGAEQLFNMKSDPHEQVDCAPDPLHAQTLAYWRSRMAAELAGRPEGWSDGTSLTPAPMPVWRMPERNLLDG